MRSVGQPEYAVPEQYRSRLHRLGAPPWLRGVFVLILAAILIGNLVFFTLGLLGSSSSRRYVVLCVVWIIAIVGLVLLVRLWRAMVPRRSYGALGCIAMFSPASVAKLQSEWNGVVKMRERMKTMAVVAFGSGAINAVALQGVLYNLPLLLAFDVLKQALVCAKNEGKFCCKGTGLGALMKASRDSLDWISWTKVHDGVGRRDMVAHDGELFSADQCLSDIELVENQLKAWGVSSVAA